MQVDFSLGNVFVPNIEDHVFVNSWHGDFDIGFFMPFKNPIGAELFEFYSFVEILPAAAVTGVALSASTNVPNEYLIQRHVYEN